MPYKRSKYFSNLISQNSNFPKLLFSTINSVLNPPSGISIGHSPELCEKLCSFFINKIACIKSHIVSNPSQKVWYLPTSPAKFSLFYPISHSELLNIVSSLRSTTCSLDVIPTSLLMEVLDAVVPNIISIINSSLQTSLFPSYFKHAVVHPLLKKVNLDPADFNNYRPISKLPFLSKVLEKAVLNQLSPYLIENNILDPFQSGFRSKHSTESALLRVVNDLLLFVDSGNCAVLLLLDLSAAFDTVDHCILLNRLKTEVGICDSALDWFESYFTVRSFSVELGQSHSAPASVTGGVPQGSILGPISFALYMLPLCYIFEIHKVPYHIYADDTQLYMSIKPGSKSLSDLLACINDIKSWMGDNFLQLNENKTEVILFGSPHLVNALSSSLGPLQANIHTHVKNLGVVFDSELKFDKQINSVVSARFF